MRRREFITLLGGMAMWPLGAQVARAAKRYRIGILCPEGPPPGFLEEFRQGLRALGYVEGQDVILEVRSADGYSQRLAALANELAKLKVDVIVAVNTPSVQAAKRASATIPIVMLRVADPVKTGLVSSLSRPGGNVTGLSLMVDELSGKRLALLKEAIPGVSRVAVLWYKPNPGSEIVVSAMKEASRGLGLDLLLMPLQHLGDLNAALQAANRRQAEAVIVIEDTVATEHRAEIINSAAFHSLPVVAQYKTFAETGALLAYGPNLSAMYRRVAFYVDRILKGHKAGDLPVEQPTEFHLVINLKTAKALAVTIPPTLLARANEVIECCGSLPHLGQSGRN
jgi:putative ABC transport system substrate-binding protein